MPFGLAHGPVYFTAPMLKVLGTFNDFCFFYMDDLLAHDSNEKDHLEHLKMIFKNIREARLTLKLSKSAFVKTFPIIRPIDF